jgi:thiamine-monophosphate kinase
MNEWNWIERLKRVVPVPADGIVGIGDDAAILHDGLLVSTDAFVESIHFRVEWASWEEIGRKAAEATISDIAAMGGEPLALFAAYAANAPGAAAERLLAGILEAGVPLLGGDSTGAPEDTVFLALTVLGRAERPVLRSGARPGDRVWISGPVGGSAAGLLSLELGLGLHECERRFLAPRARIKIGRDWAASATAMIDISDGLSSELHHLAHSSGVGIAIRGDAIPFFPGIEATGRDPLDLALGSGEEFELLATGPTSLPGGIEIGEIVETPGVTLDGKSLPASGYTHWRNGHDAA